MKFLLLFIGIMSIHSGFSQFKIEGDSTFDLVVKINYFRPNNNNGCEMFINHMTLIGTVHNVLDKKVFGDEVELIFERPWMIDRITSGSVYNLKVQYYNPIIKNKAGNDIIISKRKKLNVISISIQNMIGMEHSK